MKFGVALATLGLVAQGSAFVPSFNARQSFVGQTVAHAAAPASTRQTRQVLNMVAAAPAVDTAVLTRVSACTENSACHAIMPFVGARSRCMSVCGLGFSLLSCAALSTDRQHMREGEMNVRSALILSCASREIFPTRV